MRVKNFAFIFYPDAGDYGDLYRYVDTHAYRGCISPVHTPDNDEFKPHRHVFISLSSPRECSSLDKEFTCLGCSKVQRVGSANAYVRYMVHLDSPEKQQFDNGLREIVHFGGFDVEAVAYRSPAVTDYCSVFQRIFALYYAGEFDSYRDAVLYASVHNDMELLDYLVSHSYACSQVLNTYNNNRRDD